jgi:hypothetical protein
LRKRGNRGPSFINEEFKALLDKYLATIDKENPYLFQSKNWQGDKRKGIQNLSPRQISNILNDLINRAGIQKNGVFAWHTGRKLFMTTATELGVSPWASKLMVGKSFEISDETYVIRMKLKPDFIKISNVLKLFPKTASDGGRVKNLENALVEVEKENRVLKTRIEVLQKNSGITEDALADLLKPLIREMLQEKLLEPAKTTDLGFLTISKIPNIDAMSSAGIMELYTKLKRGEPLSTIASPDLFESLKQKSE